MKLFKVTPIIRVSLSLIAILVSWLLLLELVFGIWPSQDELIKKSRQATFVNLVTQTTDLLKTRDFNGIRTLLNNAIESDKDLVSAGIKLKNGIYAIKTDQHNQYFKLINNQNTIDNIHVELNVANKPWADFELAFKPIEKKSYFEYLKDPKLLAIIGSIIGIMVLFSLYLKKVFHYLDPSAVIPDRVRAAFDAFGEGVIMIDRSGFLVLTNKTVNQWLGDKVQYFGKHITELPWFAPLKLNKAEKYPWTDAMDTQHVVSGMRVDFKDQFETIVNAVINCTPVIDANNVSRGCLITIDNITEAEKLNAELKITNEKLNHSRIELDKQNEELRKLATRDPLTNCLNRRSFYELAEEQFQKAKETRMPLSCIMMDIDFFKKVNDVYGHATGDKVIISLAKVAFSGLRVEDLLCRYGGEEFCILLPNANIDIGMQLAERLRAEVESKVGLRVLENGESINVTSSFGVATVTSKIKTFAQLVDKADKALYDAKKQGRNRVATAALSKSTIN
jgi:diguanylate cyclase (GGDEF)-like protein